MKITRTDKDAKKLKLSKDIANKGCDKCPCCGEKKKNIDYIKEGEAWKGVAHIGCYFQSFIIGPQYKIDKYKCFTCGAEWESDPYEIS